MMALLLQSYYSITIHEEKLTPATHEIDATSIHLTLLIDLFQTGEGVETETDRQEKRPPIWSSG